MSEPTLTLKADKTTIRLGDKVTFTANVPRSIAGDEILFYFDDKNTNDNEGIPPVTWNDECTAQSTPHQYKSSGTFKAYATMKLKDWSKTITSNIKTITVNPK